MFTENLKIKGVKETKETARTSKTVRSIHKNNFKLNNL